MSSSSSNPTTISPASQDPTTTNSSLTTISPASQDPTTTASSPLTTQTVYKPPPTTSNFAIFIFLTSPIIALLPPRKLDIYTFCLGSAFVLSASHIYSSESATSSRLRRFINTRQKYSSTLNNINNNNYNNNSNNDHNYLTKNSNTAAAAAQAVERLDEERNQEDQDDDDDGGGVKSMAKKLWMGNETPGWEGRRVAREREVLDEGGGIGYGELIGESIMDVFGSKREREEKGKGD